MPFLPVIMMKDSEHMAVEQGCTVLLCRPRGEHQDRGAREPSAFTGNLACGATGRSLGWSAAHTYYPSKNTPTQRRDVEAAELLIVLFFLPALCRASWRVPGAARSGRTPWSYPSRSDNHVQREARIARTKPLTSGLDGRPRGAPSTPLQ